MHRWWMRPAPESAWAAIEIDYEQIITEDDTPVDNLFSERQQRLLAESLYASWHVVGEGRPFLAMTNVGLFFALSTPPYVPDALRHGCASARQSISQEKSLLLHLGIWQPPEIVVEIVSNRKGGGRKAGRL